MLDQELEVSVRTRRSRYVVDPAFALASPYAAQLVGRLSSHAELTVTRTFWHTIDSSHYYSRDPLAFWPNAMRETLPPRTADDFRQALALWERVRMSNDLARCRLHWISDNLSGSLLPDGAPHDLIERYESFHQALTARCDPNDDATESAAFYGAIDSLALAAALGNACLLTLAPDLPQACLSMVCAHLGLSLEPAPGEDDPLVDIERRRLRESIVAAGGSPLLWGGLRLAVVHPLLYGDLTLRIDAGEYGAADPLAMDARYDDIDPLPDSLPPDDPWRSARHFWHAL